MSSDSPGDPNYREDDTLIRSLKAEVRRNEEAAAKARADMEARLRAVEQWPQRILVAVVTGALGMILTVAGFGWSLSAQLATTSTRLDAIEARLVRVEDRLDRMEDRTWQRTDTHTSTTREE